MCDCWGCRTGNGHGATPPEGWTPGAEPSPDELRPASDSDMAAWVEAAKAWPDQLDIAYIVAATDLRIRQDGAELELLRFALRSMRIYRNAEGYVAGVLGGPDPSMAGWNDGDREEYAATKAAVAQSV